MEVSARKFALLYGEDGSMVHTNHFLTWEMQQVESEPDELVATRVRYHRAWRLLHDTEKHTLETLQAIQRDHVNYPDSICNHDIAADPLDREKTITAMIMDLTDLKMYVTWGNPCENEYQEFSLNA